MTFTCDNTCHFIPADLDLILSKSPYLIQEMVSCVAQLIAMAKAGRSKSQFVNTREQTSKPQTNYRCCLRFSFLMPYWLFPHNTLTFYKYFWCSRFCEFHSKGRTIRKLMGGLAEYKKNIRARENEMKNNSCTPINPKKYSC